MKFGKRLKRQIEDTLPEWRDKFLSYKELKKLVRLVSAAPDEPGICRAEAEFVCLLNAEVDKFNAFFVEQEEDFIIRQEELRERIRHVVETVRPSTGRPSEMEYRMEMGRIGKDLVNLHGEMVLLENYSNVNYTGLAKILKKYDKRTGNLLRLPYIEKVLEQPFFTTDLISKLIKECENTMDIVFSTEKAETIDDRGKKPMAVAEHGILRNAVAAITTMRELRRGSSTYSHFSLPPLNLPDSDPMHSFQLLLPTHIQ